MNTPFGRKGYLILLLLSLALAILFFCGWYFGGISGEIFLVDQGGTARPAPGATVDIYLRKEVSKSGSAYLASNSSGVKEYADRLLKVRKAEEKDVAGERIARALQLVQQAYCQQLSSGRSQFFTAPIEETTADRDGAFAVRLRPGNYVIFAEGQAGKSQAVWLQDISVSWRSQIHLANPVCQTE